MVKQIFQSLKHKLIGGKAPLEISVSQVLAVISCFFLTLMTTSGQTPSKQCSIRMTAVLKL